MEMIWRCPRRPVGPLPIRTPSPSLLTALLPQRSALCFLFLGLLLLASLLSASPHPVFLLCSTGPALLCVRSFSLWCEQTHHLFLSRVGNVTILGLIPCARYCTSHITSLFLPLLPPIYKTILVFSILQGRNVGSVRLSDFTNWMSKVSNPRLVRPYSPSYFYGSRLPLKGVKRPEL